VKAAAVKAAGKRKLSGARVTAAARTRSHEAWGKRHVDKASKDAFRRPATTSPLNSTTSNLYNCTKVPHISHFF
jgi:hypothetical protein